MHRFNKKKTNQIQNLLQWLMVATAHVVVVPQPPNEPLQRKLFRGATQRFEQPPAKGMVGSITIGQLAHHIESAVTHTTVRSSCKGWSRPPLAASGIKPKRLTATSPRKAIVGVVHPPPPAPTGQTPSLPCHLQPLKSMQLIDEATWGSLWIHVWN